MTYGMNEYEKLEFLTRYNFKVENFSNGRYIEISIITDKYCITYHDWPQFGDFNIFITKNREERRNYHYIAVYGYNWLLDNVLPKYRKCKSTTKYTKIDLFSFYLHDQLENHRDIFDISV